MQSYNIRQNRMSSQYAQKRHELEQAYWYAYCKTYRSGLPQSVRRKWRAHAERAAASLRAMGVFIDG